MLDQLLKKYGLKWEDLDDEGHGGEREYLTQMLEQISKTETTVASIKEHVAVNKIAIENALTNEDEFEYYFFGVFKRVNRKHLFLKARLRNYLQLEAFLDTPEKAKKVLEAQLGALAVQKRVSK